MTSQEATIFLGRKQIELYRSSPEVYIRAFRHGEANREIISQLYKVLVVKGLIRGLKQAPEYYRQEILEMAIDYSDNELDRPGLQNMVKLIYILANYA
jgi:hypothetical protein